MSYSQNLHHVQQVAETLQRDGILKVTLGFQDDDSKYLEALIRSLHVHHGHRLPISHSATRGWFWDVRPSSSSSSAAGSFQTAGHQARSETMQDFPWHTDCSYEHPPPRYFALQVLQPDRFGGGTLSAMRAASLASRLRASSLAMLMRPDQYRIRIPAEFVKDPSRRWILGSLIFADEKGTPGLIRLREDIVTPLSEEAEAALGDLGGVLKGLAAQGHETLHLEARDLPARSVIMIDNRRWLHARNHVADPERHLRRVRWDAAPFPGEEEEETASGGE